MLLSLAMIADTPAPGNVIFAVEQTSITISSLLYLGRISKIFASLSPSSVKSCTQYALSHIILKSSALGFNAAMRSTTSSLKVIPCGLEYFGTQNIPLTLGSSISSSIASISGPSSYIGIFIILMPKCSQIVKCLSYPGTGHKNLTSSSLPHGVIPSIAPLT